jgi:hypothetical protein
MWQSLTYGANYKSAYCIAVCPAGEDVIGPYLLSGSVRMAVEDALTEQDKAEGYILACQAKIRGDVKVEA